MKLIHTILHILERDSSQPLPTLPLEPGLDICICCMKHCVQPIIPERWAHSELEPRHLSSSCTGDKELKSDHFKLDDKLIKSNRRGAGEITKWIKSCASPSPFWDCSVIYTSSRYFKFSYIFHITDTIFNSLFQEPKMFRKYRRQDNCKEHHNLLAIHRKDFCKYGLAEWKTGVLVELANVGCFFFSPRRLNVKRTRNTLMVGKAE